jgi:CBS domain-containing protein
MTKSKRNEETSSGGSAAKKQPNSFLDLPVRDVMQTEVVTVTASTPLSEVERVLAEARVGGVPVTDEAGTVVGVLSIHDIVDRYTADPDARPTPAGFYQVDTAGQDETDDTEEYEGFEVPEKGEETAEQVMSAQVFSVPPSATLREVARSMVRHEVHRLLVQEDGKTVGIVSTMDLLRAMAK